MPIQIYKLFLILRYSCLFVYVLIGSVLIICVIYELTVRFFSCTAWFITIGIIYFSVSCLRLCYYFARVTWLIWGLSDRAILFFQFRVHFHCLHLFARELWCETATSCWVPPFQARFLCMALWVLCNTDPTGCWNFKIVIDEDKMLKSRRILHSISRKSWREEKVWVKSRVLNSSVNWH